MNLEYKSITFGILIILSFTGCFLEVEKTFTTSNKELCECYTNSSGESIDDRLEPCLEPFNKFMNQFSVTEDNSEEINQLTEDGLLAIVNELTKKCPSYRESFLQISKNKFISLSESEAQEIIKQSNNEYQSNIDTLKLAESYMIVSEIDKANELLDIFLSNHPEADYALWMKSYYLYMENKIYEASAAIDLAIDVTKNSDFKVVLGYYRNSINPLLNDENEEIKFKYNIEN